MSNRNSGPRSERCSQRRLACDAWPARPPLREYRRRFDPMPRERLRSGPWGPWTSRPQAGVSPPDPAPARQSGPAGSVARRVIGPRCAPLWTSAYARGWRMPTGGPPCGPNPLRPGTNGRGDALLSPPPRIPQAQAAKSRRRLRRGNSPPSRTMSRSPPPSLRRETSSHRRRSLPGATGGTDRRRGRAATAPADPAEGAPPSGRSPPEGGGSLSGGGHPDGVQLPGRQSRLVGRGA